MQTQELSKPEATVDSLDDALTALCRGDDPPGYAPDPDDVKAARSVKDGIFDGQKNWCHDE